MSTKRARLARTRRAAGFTQEDLAHRLGVDRSTVGRWEAGQTEPQAWLQPKLATALRVSRDELADMLQPGCSADRPPAAVPVADRNEDAVLNPEVLSALSDSLLLPVAPDKAPVGLAKLSSDVAQAWRMRQRAEYAALGSVLPPLLADLRATVARSDADETLLEAITQMVHGLNAASSLLKKAGEFSLALLAADRAVEASRRINDGVLTAAATHRLVNVLLPAGRLDECQRIALIAADAIHPRVMQGSRETAMWGGLLLTAAVAAARRGDGSAAWELMGEARVAGQLIDSDYADFYTIFGPTNIALHGVQVAVELRDGPDAVRRGQRVSVDSLPVDLLERRGQFLLDLTTGSVLAGDYDGASALLCKADAIAPEEVRFSPAAHEALSILLHSTAGAGASSPLRELATRMSYGG